MADLRSDGTPNVAARELRLKELRVDLHGLEHQVLRYELEIARWRDNIAKHEESIARTRERIQELSTMEVAELSNTSEPD